MADEEYQEEQGGGYGDEQQEEQGGGYGDEPQQEYEAEPEAEPEADPEPEYKEPEPEPEPEPQYEQQDYGDVQPKQTVEACCEDLYSDNPSFSWFTTKLVDPKVKTADLKIDRAGKGGLNELIDYMKGQKSDIVFFLLRVNTYDNESSVRAKFIYGRFVGTGVKFMAKAKLTPNLGKIADQFPVKHLSKDADESMAEFTPEKLSKEFLRIGGAHKPSKYDYGPNAVFEV